MLLKLIGSLGQGYLSSKISVPVKDESSWAQLAPYQGWAGSPSRFEIGVLSRPVYRGEVGKMTRPVYRAWGAKNGTGQDARQKGKPRFFFYSWILLRISQICTGLPSLIRIFPQTLYLVRF